MQTDWQKMPGHTGDQTIYQVIEATNGNLVAVGQTTASTAGGSYYLGAGRIRASSAFIDITIAQPYIALKSNPTAVRRGEKAQVIWDIEHKKPFEGEADATLLGLPKGVTVINTPKLKAGDKQLIFEISATPEALLGQYKELSCEITVTERNQQIRQRTGKAILRVDPALQKSALK